MEKETTIKDIAKLANVSISTVSRVINGLDRVNDNTRKKVTKVIKEMDYVPNNVAVSMVKKKTKMIVVMVPDIINPFYTAVIQGTEAIAKSQGYFTFIFSTNDSKQEEEDFLKGIMSRGIDGIITVSSSKDPYIYENLSIPAVFIDRYVENRGLDGVVIDNFGGSYQAVEHLIENGHEDIAIINGPTNFNIGKDRYKGYLQALKDNEIVCKEEFVKKVQWNEKDGYLATEELLQLKPPPTAIFPSNNLLCMGAIRALRDHNIKIGEEISLIGLDDNELATFSNPKITVVDRPTYDMGKQGARILLDKIEGINKSPSPTKVILGTALIKRGSVKNIN